VEFYGMFAILTTAAIPHALFLIAI